MAVRTAYAPVAASVLTAANLAKLPGGWIGDASVTANQTGITAITDLTGLTVTVTVGTGRRIEVEGWFQASQVTASGAITFVIAEGATLLQTAQLNFGVGLTPMYIKCTLTPTSGAHTYKLQAATSAGTLSLLASATQPAQIVVKDLGATP